MKSPYYPFRSELSVLGSVILRGTRLVVPQILRQRILDLAHEGHPGESVMKRRVRSKVWWPLIDREVEKHVKSCKDCLIVSQPNKPVPMARSSFPEEPWACLAMDILGPLPNRDYLVVIIDYFSRYMELKFMKKTPSSAIIKFLSEIFSRHGNPRSIKTDNGPQFVSHEFEEFCKLNNIQHVTSPPYWPQANGLVENMNDTLGKRLEIAHNNKLNYQQEINKFIMMYNTTPHGTTNVAPSELIFKRVIRDKIPSIQDVYIEPVLEEAKDMDMIRKQKGKEREDTRRGAKETDLDVGDRVLLRNVLFPNKLTPTFDSEEYEVVERENSEVLIKNRFGKMVRRNISHVKKIPSLNQGRDILENENEEKSKGILLDEQSSSEPKVKPLKLKNIGVATQRSTNQRRWRRPDYACGQEFSF
jgi:transposase InsO family protein